MTSTLMFTSGGVDRPEDKTYSILSYPPKLILLYTTPKGKPFLGHRRLNSYHTLSFLTSSFCQTSDDVVRSVLHYHRSSTSFPRWVQDLSDPPTRSVLYPLFFSLVRTKALTTVLADLPTTNGRDTSPSIPSSVVPHTSSGLQTKTCIIQSQRIIYIERINTT